MRLLHLVGFFEHTRSQQTCKTFPHLNTENAEQIWDILIIYYAPLCLDVRGGASVGSDWSVCVSHVQREGGIKYKWTATFCPGLSYLHFLIDVCFKLRYAKHVS